MTSGATPETEITRDEFCRRVAERVVKRAGGDIRDADGVSVREYAEATAPTYWEDPDQRADGPKIAPTRT